MREKEEFSTRTMALTPAPCLLHVRPLILPNISPPEPPPKPMTMGHGPPLP